MAKATKVNPHTGSSFDDFLKEDGIYEEVQARALKRALAEQLDDAMQSVKLSKVIYGTTHGHQPLPIGPRAGPEQPVHSARYTGQSGQRSG